MSAAESVDLGQRTPGKYERLAFARHEKDLALTARPSGHPRGLYFDPEAGERVVRFVEDYCKHYEGEWAGQKIQLEEWQRQLIRILFGWRRRDGTRRFRTAYIEIPRKNGKSFLCSALSLYLLIADDEPGAQIYSFATKEEQATIVWRGAVAMVEQSPDLERFVTIHSPKKKTGGTIFCDRTRSFFRPLGADSSTQDGLNPHGSVADELHEHKDRRVWTKLKTALGARRQPLQIEITTAGVYDPESIGWERHKYAADVLDGVFQDDATFAFIAAADDEDDWFSVETQRKANPNYGVSAKVDMLAEMAALAKKVPRVYNDYLRYHLNRWTQQVTRWLSVERWKECDDVPADVAVEIREEREEALRGRPCHAGLDLSSKLDLTALVLAFTLPDGSFELICRFWLPQNTIDDQAKKGQTHYETWARDGWITATPGDVIDYAFIRAELNELRKRYPILEVAIDPHNATQISTELREQDGFETIDMPQGFAHLSEPSKAFEAKIVERKVRHGGNPVLRWMVGNAVVKKGPNTTIRPDKEKASGKIDGVVAAIMATGRANVNGGANAGSYLEEGPLLTV